MQYKTDEGKIANVFYISDVYSNKLANGEVHLHVVEKKGDVDGQYKFAPVALTDVAINIGDYFVELEGNTVGIYSEAEISEWTPVEEGEISNKAPEEKKPADDKGADAQLGDEGDDSLDDLIDEEDAA